MNAVVPLKSASLISRTSAAYADRRGVWSDIASDDATVITKSGRTIRFIARSPWNIAVYTLGAVVRWLELDRAPVWRQPLVK